MPEFTGTKDLRTYLRILWRWKVLFLVFLIGAPVVAYLIERGQPKTYRSSALVGVNGATVDTTVLQGGSFSTTNVQAVAQLVTTRPVAARAARLMKPPANPGEIVGEITTSADTNTNFLTINAEDRSPQRAAAIANAFAQAIAINRQNAAVQQLNSAIKGIRTQISHLGGVASSPNSPEASTLSQLEAQLNQFRAARATQSGQAAILQSAVPSSTPAGPQTRRSVELAALIGLLLGLGAVVLAESGDRRLRRPDELEKMADVPLLATIPPSAFSAKLDTGPADEEAFQMLRTSLLYFNPASVHQSIVITSPGEKDGKTTHRHVRVSPPSSAGERGTAKISIEAEINGAYVMGTSIDIDATEVVTTPLTASFSGFRLRTPAFL